MSDVIELTPKQKIEQACKELGIKMEAIFVPFSQSRNNGKTPGRERWRSLNWIVSLQRCTHTGVHELCSEILKTEYSSGDGNCPASKRPQRFGNASTNVDKQANERRIAWECEQGLYAGFARDSALGGDGFFVFSASPKRKIEPELADVISSLVSDADVLDYPTFEDWASNYGMDTDSRKAEATYRACLEIALKLRNGIGEAGLAKLRDAAQDY